MDVSNKKEELLFFSELMSVFSQKTILYLFKQAVKAIHAFHTLTNKAYLDVKPDNFVIKSDYTVALIDFGHATELGLLTNKRTGTKEYNAPEVHKSI